MCVDINLFKVGLPTLMPDNAFIIKRDFVNMSALDWKPFKNNQMANRSFQYVPLSYMT